MIFDELTYFLIFLLPSVVAFHWVARAWKPWVLALSGTLFFVYYGYLHFGGALGSACVAIFLWELAVSRFYRKGSWMCVLGIVQAVLILVAFKYLPFFERVWSDLLAPQGGPRTTALILPLGISFFTFEFIHFAADSRAGRIQNARLGEYSAFIFFFPSMVAGPIKRFQHFQRELRVAAFSPAMASQGITRILAGLAKKHVLADTFALWAAHLQTADLPSTGRGVLVWWILAYGMRIYFDFSGYSDIAIGSGMLFGIALPENFRWPYSSAGIMEFWRRWHISLSSWIRDYVYIPLGGSRGSRFRTTANLLVAFGLSGLWHGAAYNFVAWGLWHGVMTAIERAWRGWAGPRGISLPRLAAQGLTFSGVMLGWVLFCVDFPRAVLIFQQLLRGSA